MKTLRLALMVLSLSAPAAGANGATPLPCQDSMTPQEQDVCIQTAVQNADREIDKLFHLVERGLKGGATDPMLTLFPQKQRALLASQRTWKAYRDAQCLAVSASYGAGSGAAAGYGFCMFELSQERIKFLRNFGQTVLYDSTLCRDHNDECAPLREAQ